jgi:hypothetical protein
LDVIAELEEEDSVVAVVACLIRDRAAIELIGGLVGGPEARNRCP